MKNFEDFDHYEILQVSPSAESEVIEAAYKKLAHKYHPDINKSLSSSEKMRKINIARDVLCDPVKRSMYHTEWLQKRENKKSFTGTQNQAKSKPKPASGAGNPEGSGPIRHTGRTKKVSCPKCHQPILSGTQQCSHCGCLISWGTPKPQQKQQNYYRQTAKPKKSISAWLVGFSMVLGAVILVTVTAVLIQSIPLVNTTSKSGQTPPASLPTSSPATISPPSYTPPEAPPTIYSMNQDVNVNSQAKWRVLSSRNVGNVLKGSESRYPSFKEDKTTSGKFIEVTFIVENISGKTKTLPVPPEIVDSQNREFGTAEEYYLYVPNDMDYLLITLQPNVPKNAIVIYDLPQNATGLKFLVNDFSSVSGETALIDLGL